MQRRRGRGARTLRLRPPAALVALPGHALPSIGSFSATLPAPPISESHPAACRHPPLLARARAEGRKPTSRAATREAVSCSTLKPFQPSRTTSAFSTSLATWQVWGWGQRQSKSKAGFVAGQRKLCLGQSSRAHIDW